MICQLVCNKSNTAGATSRAGTAYPSGAPEYTPGFSGIRATKFLVLCVMFCRSLFILLSFFFWLLLFVLLLLTIVVCPSSFDYCCLSFFFWLLCCLSFFFWLLCCLSFFFWLLLFVLLLLTIVLFVLLLLTIVLFVLLIVDHCLETHPIRTSHPVNSAFWLDDTGVKYETCTLKLYDHAWGLMFGEKMFPLQCWIWKANFCKGIKLFWKRAS